MNFFLSCMPSKNDIIYSKEHNMKSSCILITKISKISWLFVFWIDAKLNGHYLCLDFNLSSHIVVRTNKGKTHYPIVCTLHLKKEMKLITNNVMSSSTPNIFDLKHYSNFLWQTIFFSNLWRFEKRSFCYWHQRLME